MKKIERQGAQGDVMFVRVAEIPDGATERPAGRIVVAHSETGHHHTIDDTGVVHYTTKDPLVCYLQLAGIGECRVIHHRPHDTHETLGLGGGLGAVWKVIRQREYTPEGWRRVED